MKIEIQNLGPIHHFEFDLEKDLHLLYGKNNVGKSVAASTIYILLKCFEASTDKAQLKQFLRLEVKDYDVEDMEFEPAFKYFFEKTILFQFEYALRSAFQNNGEKDTFFRSGHTYFVITLPPKIKLIVRINGWEDFVLEDFNIPEPKPDSDVNEAVVESFSEVLIAINKSVHEIYFLPSSRSGLYLYLGQISRMFVELSKHRALFKDKQSIDLIPLSPPMADYFNRLSSIDNKIKSKNLEKLALSIENNLFQGRIHFDFDSKKIMYHSEDGNSVIDLMNTASMISELAPLVLFVKYVITPKEGRKSLLIIEEPEAHLHPEVQVQLMEIFAELTKHNVKVILTSHSNYMFNKLSNMLLAKEIEPEKVGVYHMVMTEKGSIVRPDMQASTEGIEDHNFADVAQKLYNERLKIYHILNEEG